MKKILVPTDFSENALYAFRFATALSPFLHASLEAVHVHALPETEVVADARFQESLEKWMNTFVEEGLRQSDLALAVETRLLQGITESQLIRLSGEPNVEMMVMGAEGSGGIGKKWFGSVAETVARQARCPVLLVPESASFKGFRHILFASDYAAAEPEALDKLIAFASRFHASIHFVHVEKPGEGEEYALVEQRILEYLFRNGAPGFAFEMTCLHTDQITKGLEQYAAQNHIDLIVMVAAHRSFWEVLFHHSQTKAMILSSKMPLLVLHLST